MASRFLVLAVFVLIVWGCRAQGDYDDSDDLTGEVVSCEEAIGHLEKCCPDFDAVRDGQCVDDKYKKTGGGCVYDDYTSTTTGYRLPEMTLAESQCVRTSSCDELIAKGICDRVKRNGLRGEEHYVYDEYVDHQHDAHDTVYPHEAVCP